MGLFSKRWKAYLDGLKSGSQIYESFILGFASSAIRMYVRDGGR